MTFRSLNVWGGLFNEENHEMLRSYGIDPDKKTYYDDDVDYISDLLDQIAKAERKTCMRDHNKGYGAKHKPIVKIIFVYKGEEYIVEHEHLVAQDIESVLFWWLDGNGACDDNRSLEIRKSYSDFPELDCGGEITIKNIDVLYKQMDPVEEVV